MPPPIPTCAVMALLLCLAGCGDPQPQDFWGAIPDPQLVALPVLPNGTDRSGVCDALAAFVRPTYGLLGSITSERDPVPTPGQGLVWRTVPGFNERVVWRLTIQGKAGSCSTPDPIQGCTHKPAQSWTWRLEGKPKMRSDSEFRVAASGERASPEWDADAELGGGHLFVDWTALCSLLAEPGLPCGSAGLPVPESGQHGTADIHFAAEDGRALTLTASLHTLDATERFVGDWTCEAARRADGSGRVSAWAQFSFPGTPENTAGESWSRGVLMWTDSGAAQEDWTGGFGTLSAPAGSPNMTVTCWDSMGDQTFSHYLGGNGYGGTIETRDGSESTCVAPALFP